MLPLLTKISVLATAWGLFLYTILHVNYPESLVTANTYQLAYFFIPLFLGLTMIFSFKFNFFSSSSIALGLIILLILKAFDSLNLATGIITSVAIFLLASASKNISFKSKVKRSLTPRLTPRPKKPKLTRKL